MGSNPTVSAQSTRRQFSRVLLQLVLVPEAYQPLNESTVTVSFGRFTMFADALPEFRADWLLAGKAASTVSCHLGLLRLLADTHDWGWGCRGVCTQFQLGLQSSGASAISSNSVAARGKVLM